MSEYQATHTDVITREIREARWTPRADYVCGCNPANLCSQHATIRAAEHYHPELASVTAVPPRPATPTPAEIREHVDSIVPRTHEDGLVNAEHVAIEQTLRTRYGHPSYIAELDGPSKFYPAAPDATAGGGLRSAINRALFRSGADNYDLAPDLILAALRDVLAAAARDAEKVDVLADIADERALQDAKWGQQNHRDGTGAFPRADRRAADEARRECQLLAAAGMCTWRAILAEEVAEAFAETEPDALRAELVQVAAVAVQWIQAIDRRALDGT